MSNLQFNSINVDNIRTGNTPPEIKIYYSEGNKIGNYYYCFPTRMEQKSFKAAENWVSGTPKFDIVKNEFKQIKLFGVSERFITNRRLFKVLLNNKYIVELEEEMLFHALSYFSCSKSNFTGIFKFGLMGNNFKLYPETPPFKAKMKELTDVYTVKNKSKFNKPVNNSKQKVIASKVQPNTVYKLSKFHKDAYLYLGKNENNKHIYLKFTDGTSDINFGKYATGLENKFWGAIKTKAKDSKCNIKDFGDRFFWIDVCSKYKSFTFQYDLNFEVPELDDFKLRLEYLIDKRVHDGGVMHIINSLDNYKRIFGDKYEADRDKIISDVYLKKPKRKDGYFNMNILYRYKLNCGRMGDVESLFVSTKEEIEKSLGKNICFGEILGKHSDINDNLSLNNLTIVSEDQDFINKLVEILGSKTISGNNPLNYMDEEFDDAEENDEEDE